MANNITDVFGNSIDDLFDDYTTTVLFKETKTFFEPLRKSYEGDNQSDWDNAVSSAINTLQMGISMYAVGWINSVMLPALYKRASIAFSYIVAGKLVKKLKSLNLGGKTMRKGMNVLSDVMEHRQKNTEIALNMMQHQDTVMMKKMEIANHTKRSFDGTVLGSVSDNQITSIDLMTNKTKTGTWSSSHEDRKLYERATGTKLKKGFPWSKLYKKLNSFSEFAQNAEDHVINLAQVQFDTFVANGSTKV